MSGGQQLSFFSVEARPPSVEDVEGLLAGPAHVVRRDDSARISVVLDEDWRVPPLVAELDALGLGPDTGPAEQGGTTVRTAFSPALRAVALRWTSGAIKVPPTGFVLDGARLRFWVLAGGHREEASFHLPLGAGDEAAWPRIGAALAAAGVTGTFVGPRAAGPAYRVTGMRRLSRLRELVGEPPAGLRPEAWP